MYKIELNAQISPEERKSLEFYVKSVLRIRKKAKPMSNGIAIELTKFEEYASLLNQLARIGTFGDVEVLGVTRHNDGKKIAVQVEGSDYIWGIFFNVKETPVKTGKKAFPAAEQFLSDFALRGSVSEGPKINGVKRCYVNAWHNGLTGVAIGRGETFYVFGKDEHTGEKYVAAHTKKSTSFIYYSEAMNESIDLFAKGRQDHYNLAKSYVFDAYLYGSANAQIYTAAARKNFAVSNRDLRSKEDFTSAIKEAKANIRQIDKWLAEDDNSGVQSKLNAAKSHLEVSINAFERWAKNAVSDKAVDLLTQIDRSLNDAKTSEWITLLCQTDGSFQVDCFNKIKTAIRKAGKANELIAAMRDLAVELNYQAKVTKSLEKYLTESDDVSGFLETFGDKVGFDAAKHARENGWEFEDYRILNTRVWKDDEGEKCSFLVQKGENGEPFDVLCESYAEEIQWFKHEKVITRTLDSGRALIKLKVLDKRVAGLEYHEVPEVVAAAKSLRGVIARTTKFVRAQPEREAARKEGEALYWMMQKETYPLMTKFWKTEKEANAILSDIAQTINNLVNVFRITDEDTIVQFA